MQVQLILIFVALLWGLNPSAMKVGLLSVEPMSYNFIRMILAGVLSWLVARKMVTFKSLRHCGYKEIMIASGGFFLFQIFFTTGVKLTTVGNASLILSCLPISVAVINYLHKFEQANVNLGYSIICSLVGVIIMIFSTGQSFSLESNHLIGGIMLLLAQFCYAYYTVFSKQSIKEYSPYQVTTHILLISTILLLPFSFNDFYQTNWSNLPWEAWASIFYSGIFPLFLGNILWIWGAGVIGSNKASLYNNLPPVFSVLLGCLFFEEKFGLLNLLGVSLIIVGLIISKKTSKNI